MKTDLVLTMDEYLKACCLSQHQVDPPAQDARHIPITTKHDGGPAREHGCRCDRWGHPCPGCIEKTRLQSDSAYCDFIDETHR
jgi:hypothetical protein